MVSVATPTSYEKRMALGRRRADLHQKLLAVQRELDDGLHFRRDGRVLKTARGKDGRLVYTGVLSAEESAQAVADANAALEERRSP